MRDEICYTFMTISRKRLCPRAPDARGAWTAEANRPMMGRMKEDDDSTRDAMEAHLEARIVFAALMVGGLVLVVGALLLL